MPRFHRIHGERVQFTLEEEIERDEEERLGDLEIIAVREKANKVAELEAKLTDDSITFKQLKELMRLRG